MNISKNIKKNRSRNRGRNGNKRRNRKRKEAGTKVGTGIELETGREEEKIDIKDKRNLCVSMRKTQV
jgi:hypothetical protein